MTLYLPSNEDWMFDEEGNEYEDVNSAMDLVESFSDGSEAPTPYTGPSVADQFSQDYDSTDEVTTSYGGGH